MGDPCLKRVHGRKVVEEDNQNLNGPGNLAGQLTQQDRTRERPVVT